MEINKNELSAISICYPGCLYFDRYRWGCFRQMFYDPLNNPCLKSVVVDKPCPIEPKKSKTIKQFVKDIADKMGC